MASFTGKKNQSNFFDRIPKMKKMFINYLGEMQIRQYLGNLVLREKNAGNKCQMKWKSTACSLVTLEVNKIGGKQINGASLLRGHDSFGNSNLHHVNFHPMSFNDGTDTFILGNEANDKFFIFVKYLATRP